LREFLELFAVFLVALVADLSPELPAELFCPKAFFAFLRTVGPDPDDPLQTYFGFEMNNKKELKPKSFFITLL